MMFAPTKPPVTNALHYHPDLPGKAFKGVVIGRDHLDRQFKAILAPNSTYKKYLGIGVK
jgi:hypothetical protein